MASLLNKLRMLDAEPKKPAPSPSAAGESSFYRSHSVFPLSLFGTRTDLIPAVLERLFGCAFPDSIEPEDILFLDTETTGLSGGAVSLAFEIGVGYFTNAGFVVEQFFMHDYAQEGAMLRALHTLIQRFDVLCTFNGRTFDVPLLKSRFVMNRIVDDPFPVVHADVLHPARRLWKLRLKRCSLGRLEEELLHVQREDDLPGAMVPQTYFQYLKDGLFEPIRQILEHNKQDVVSLAQLLFFMCRHASRPEAIPHGADLLSLAKAMEKAGAQEEAVRCYRLGAQGSLQGPSLQALGRIEKRCGHVQSAIAIYQTMLKQHADPVYACEALAKLYEHQLHDLPSAISYTRQALLLLAEPSLFQDGSVQDKQSLLQYRYARLRRKLSAQTK